MTSVVGQGSLIFFLIKWIFSSKCIRCDDSIYGQIGCKGECDSEDYFNLGFVYCKECKEGYYNLEGICKNCE